ncbi:hypothetical protein FANTH_13989 [Fusarium anthophilum]|uniref:PRISE-like Rossmann-fold domain-containing protein n=1 Tax=Fusarium anthophilum TaxID=48485 RepID=A0A8H5DNG0_9HYPO|nr:hypothetical protein FANTH_13989 [Fusarium anthophilum]
MAPARGKVAFVTGANGITGNAIIEHLIRKPESEWSKIIITSRRVPKQSLWQDHRVRFVALDFLNPVEELIQRMAPLCHDVTHSFFTSYVHIADFAKLRDSNIPLFHNFLVAIDIVTASTLQRICLQTSGKYYGPHLGPTEVPLHEEIGRYDYNVSDHQSNELTRTVGNGMSMALTLAIYMLVCREMGVPPIFPGNKSFFNQCVDDSSYAPSIADLSVWAVTDEHTENEAFNHQNGDVFVWKQLWGKLGQYFGIKPIPACTQFPIANHLQVPEFAEWHKDKKQVWERDFFDWAVGKAWLTIGSVGKARKFGWKRYDDTYDTYVETFRAFENAGVLPYADVLRAEKNKSQPTQASLAPHPYDAVTLMKSKVKKEPNGVDTNGLNQEGLKNGLHHGHVGNGDLAVKA